MAEIKEEKSKKDKGTEGRGQIINRSAPNFTLPQHTGGLFELQGEVTKGPVILAFYPGGALAPVCTAQFCDYRDNSARFSPFGVRIIGISSDPSAKQSEFAQKQQYPFTFLSDPGNRIAQLYECKSFFMFGAISRAIFIVNQKGMILYRYIEPTTLTRKGSSELVGILTDLREYGLI